MTKRDNVIQFRFVQSEQKEEQPTEPENCRKCRWFKHDPIRSRKLNEDIGICTQIANGFYVIADFRAEDCTDFRLPKGYE